MTDPTPPRTVMRFRLLGGRCAELAIQEPLTKRDIDLLRAYLALTEQALDETAGDLEAP